MTSINQLLGNKGRNVHVLDGAISVGEAAKKCMILRSALSWFSMQTEPLRRNHNQRDIMRVVASGKSTDQCLVADAMTGDLTTLSPGDSIDHALQVMTTSRIRHVTGYRTRCFGGTHFNRRLSKGATR